MADYLKIPEVARRLDVSEPTVRRMVKGGKLPSVFVGGAYRVSEADLAEFLENAKVEPGKAPAQPSAAERGLRIRAEDLATREASREINRLYDARTAEEIDAEEYQERLVALLISYRARSDRSSTEAG